jgi:hypothetical protein
MIIYIAIVLIVLTLVITIAFSFTEPYQELGANRAAEHTAIVGLERMVRDIHAASDYDALQSSFATSTGILYLTTGATTTRFYLSSGELRVDVNGVFLGPLSVSHARVTSLMFRPVVTAISKAIRIDLTVEGTQGRATKTKTFQTTAILKKS